MPESIPVCPGGNMSICRGAVFVKPFGEFAHFVRAIFRLLILPSAVALFVYLGRRWRCLLFCNGRLFGGGGSGIWSGSRLILCPDAACVKRHHRNLKSHVQKQIPFFEHGWGPSPKRI